MVVCVIYGVLVNCEAHFSANTIVSQKTPAIACITAVTLYWNKWDWTLILSSTLHTYTGAYPQRRHGKPYATTVPMLCHAMRITANVPSAFPWYYITWVYELRRIRHPHTHTHITHSHCDTTSALIHSSAFVGRVTTRFLSGECHTIFLEPFVHTPCFEALHYSRKMLKVSKSVCVVIHTR